MTPLSTLTNEALHARVARSLEGVTEGPWFVDAKAAPPELSVCDRDCIIATTLTNENSCDPEAQELSKKSDMRFIAQSRDLVPELDRRLKDESGRRLLAEARLEVAMEALTFCSSFSDKCKTALSQIEKLEHP